MPTEKTLDKHKLVIDEWFVNGWNGFTKPNLKYYVYALINPMDNKPFYIGKGKNKRAKRHLSEVKKGNIVNHKKHFIIQQLISVGLKPSIAVIENNLTETESYKIESYLINNFKENLSNIQSGRLTKQQKYVLWAETELLKLKSYNQLKFVEKRSKEMLSLYLRNVKLLFNIIEGKVIWHPN
ncbi:GIY-YIG nuclease family protein [uncultured Winogradskyella sp.]|uniref:GIY-YIG nuclease family protein n=1 Tax=uncultured Winogradskyella sp. TaxID=395353 RepID=UPI00260AF6AC|nr:GIY-YIG nuclease family protein [uncultured Winogradskyella sp.]